MNSVESMHLQTRLVLKTLYSYQTRTRNSTVPLDSYQTHTQCTRLVVDSYSKKVDSVHPYIWEEWEALTEHMKWARDVQLEHPDVEKVGGRRGLLLLMGRQRLRTSFNVVKVPVLVLRSADSGPGDRERCPWLSPPRRVPSRRVLQLPWVEVEKDAGVDRQLGPST